MDAATLKGARSKADVDPAFVELLEQGLAESRTHIEQMSMSMSRLLRHTFPEVEYEPMALDGLPFITRLRAIGVLLHDTYGSSLVTSENAWLSDTVRGWIAMSVAADRSIGLGEAVERLRPFARDHHFAVREWAWLAARPRVVHDPGGAIAVLEPLVRSDHALERRFAIELTRPRSVWGDHIPLLKNDPEIAEDLLREVKCDPDAYVRHSVGNWLRDAGRSRPDWTWAVTSTWLEQCPCKATAWIVRRGRSSLPPLDSFQIRAEGLSPS